MSSTGELLVVALSVPAIHGAKTTKNQTPPGMYCLIIYNQTVFQKAV